MITFDTPIGILQNNDLLYDPNTDEGFVVDGDKMTWKTLPYSEKKRIMRQYVDQLKTQKHINIFDEHLNPLRSLDSIYDDLIREEAQIPIEFIEEFQERPVTIDIQEELLKDDPQAIKNAQMYLDDLQENNSSNSNSRTPKNSSSFNQLDDTNNSNWFNNNLKSIRRNAAKTFQTELYEDWIENPTTVKKLLTDAEFRKRHSTKQNQRFQKIFNTLMSNEGEDVARYATKADALGMLPKAVVNSKLARTIGISFPLMDAIEAPIRMGMGQEWDNALVATGGSALGSVGGMALGGAIGATVGSVVPVVGTAIGAVGGSLLGGAIGGIGGERLASNAYQIIEGDPTEGWGAKWYETHPEDIAIHKQQGVYKGSPQASNNNVRTNTNINSNQNLSSFNQQTVREKLLEDELKRYERKKQKQQEEEMRLQMQYEMLSSLK